MNIKKLNEEIEKILSSFVVNVRNSITDELTYQVECLNIEDAEYYYDTLLQSIEPDEYVTIDEYTNGEYSEIKNSTEM